MHKRTREEWQVLFAEQGSSGVSVRQFCLQRDLCPKYFSLRRRQLPSVARPAFVRVQKAPVAAEPAVSCRVVLRHGRSELELHAISPEWLSRLLVALA